MRSSVVPQTNARETAQNTNWKKNNAAGAMLYVPSSGILSAASASLWPTFRKKPWVPAIVPAPPNASAKPTAQYASEAIEKFMSTFATPAPAFFIREKPISSSRNPACMNITRMAATITHVVSTAEAVSVSVGPSAAAATAGSARATSEAPPTRAARRRGPARSVRLNIEGSSLVAEAPVGARFQRRRQCRTRKAKGLYPCVGNSARPFRQPVESPCTVRQMGRWGRFGGFAGAAGVLLFLAGALLVGERPPFSADATDVAGYVADHRTRIQVACALFATAVPLFVWFLVAVASHTRARR